MSSSWIKVESDFYRCLFLFFYFPKRIHGDLKNRDQVGHQLKGKVFLIENCEMFEKSGRGDRCDRYELMQKSTFIVVFQ